MAIKLKQSTASQEIPLGPFLDSVDGDSEEAALTIANTDIKLWKTGATTLASKNSGGATYISNGVYYTVLDATDTNTLGSMVVFVHVAGALAVRVECEVLDEATYDALVGGTTTEAAAVPSVTANFFTQFAWLLSKSRNKVTQTATTQLIKADDGTTTIGTSTVSDDGVTFTRGEYA